MLIAAVACDRVIPNACGGRANRKICRHRSEIPNYRDCSNDLEAKTKARSGKYAIVHDYQRRLGHELSRIRHGTDCEPELDFDGYQTTFLNSWVMSLFTFPKLTICF